MSVCDIFASEVQHRAAEVLKGQTPSGAFGSTVYSRRGVIEDETCFITALVLMELVKIRSHLSFSMENVIRRGLNFILGCSYAAVPGSFHFYSADPRSPRLEYENLGPDIDDTVLANTAMVLLHHRTAQDARRMLREVIEPWAVAGKREQDPPWVTPGVFRTWFTEDLTDNPVDLCVNANVVALYALCGDSNNAHCQAVCMMLEKAASVWAENRPDLALSCPYYAHPVELVYAIQRAYEWGAQQLGRALEILKSPPWAQVDIRSKWPRNRPICGDASGTPFWMAPSLQAARQLRLEMFDPVRRSASDVIQTKDGSTA